MTNLPGWNAPLLWCDLETTGLDEKHNLLLEVGLVLTEGRTFREVACVSGIVGYPDIRSRVRNEHVREMHERSGLFNAVETSLLTLREVEDKLIAWCEEHGVARLCMAGSGVADFERRWVPEHMPRLWAHAFNHQYMDMLTLRRYHGIPRLPGPHRVLGDLRRDIGMVREIRTLLDKAALGPAPVSA